MSSELITPDNTFINIPNRSVWGQSIFNYTRRPIRHVDVSVGTAYDGDRWRRKQGHRCDDEIHQGVSTGIGRAFSRRRGHRTGRFFREPGSEGLEQDLGSLDSERGDDQGYFRRIHRTESRDTVPTDGCSSGQGGLSSPSTFFSNVFPITSRYEGFYWSKSL